MKNRYLIGAMIMSVAIASFADEQIAVESAMETVTFKIRSKKINFDSLTWKKSSGTQKDGKSIVVETAKVEGFDIKAFRATSIYDATSGQMKAAIFDMPHFTEWMDGAVVATLIHQVDEYTQATYYENAAPFPVKHRDGVVIQHVVRLDENTISIQIHENNELIGEKKGLVRVTHMEGDWILQDLEDGKTKLTYQAHLDPNGAVPDWVINMIITGAPTNTMKNLHDVDYSIYSSERLNPELAALNER